MTLAEDAHRRAETALGHIDDSGGWLTDISHRVAGLHQAGVGCVRPDPRALAEQLFKLEMDANTLDTFHRAQHTYVDALSEAGVFHYRELVEASWAEVDHTGPRWENFRLREAGVAIAMYQRFLFSAEVRSPSAAFLPHTRQLSTWTTPLTTEDAPSELTTCWRALCRARRAVGLGGTLGFQP